MYQVQVMLSCTDINSFTERNVYLLPKKDDEVVCKVCKQNVKVLHVGKPYQVKDVSKERR